jgi:hypothetical protein
MLRSSHLVLRTDALRQLRASKMSNGIVVGCVGVSVVHTAAEHQCIPECADSANQP